MANNLQPKITYAVLGGLACAALQFGFVVTKADLEQVRTETYQVFETRQEVDAKLNSIDAKLDHLTDLILKKG